MKKKYLILLGILLVLLGLAAAFGYKYYKWIYSDNVKSENDQMFVYISKDSDFSDVVDSLKPYLEDVKSFEWVADKKNYLNMIHPGRYLLKPDYSNNKIVNILRSGQQEPVNLTFNNIRTLKELAGEVDGYLYADSAEIADYLLHDETPAEYGFNKFNFPAMFIPDTYEFYWDTDPAEFCDRMKEEYENFWNKRRERKAEKTGLSKKEISTLASIIEKESVKNDEKPLIAGVYMNRLEAGMFLQACPTLIYATGDFTITRVLDKHKKIDSPYNTYKNKGLPPGPVCLPEKSSIDAVLNYKDHNYYYFCAKPDNSGYHHFSKTYSQHLQYANKYQNHLNSRRIYR